jgi:hypothetical protein
MLFLQLNTSIYFVAGSNIKKRRRKEIRVCCRFTWVTAGQSDNPFKIAFQFVISRRDGSEMFQSRKYILYEVVVFVEAPIHSKSSPRKMPISYSCCDQALNRLYTAFHLPNVTGRLSSCSQLACDKKPLLPLSGAKAFHPPKLNMMALNLFQYSSANNCRGIA